MEKKKKLRGGGGWRPLPKEGTIPRDEQQRKYVKEKVEEKRVFALSLRRVIPLGIVK